MNITELKITNLVEYQNQTFAVKEIFEPKENHYYVKIEKKMTCIYLLSIFY